MNKAIVFGIACSTLVMCKKLESTPETMSALDSSAQKEMVMDSPTLGGVQRIEIKDSMFTDPKLEAEPKAVENNAIQESSKSRVDSLIQKEVEKEQKINTKQSTTSATPEAKPVQITITPSKVVKETKIIYKKDPQNGISEPTKMVKSGSIQIQVSDLELAKEQLVQDFEKFDAVVQSENLTGNSNSENYYFQIAIPTQKFDFLVNAAAELGRVNHKDILSSGDAHRVKSTSKLDIVLTRDLQTSAGIATNTSFGDRSWSAVVSGWKFLEKILLFFLPLWPLIFATTIFYYMYKRRSKNTDKSEF